MKFIGNTDKGKQNKIVTKWKENIRHIPTTITNNKKIKKIWYFVSQLNENYNRILAVLSLVLLYTIFRSFFFLLLCKFKTEKKKQNMTTNELNIIFPCKFQDLFVLLSKYRFVHCWKFKFDLNEFNFFI